MTHPTDDEAFRPAFAFSERALAILKRLAEQDFSNILGLDEFSRGMAFNRAAALVLQGRTEEAFQIYTALAMLSPLDSEALIGMARCAMTMLDHDSAMHIAAAIIAIAPTDPRGFLISGKSCFMLGLFDEALEDLRDAQRLAAGDIGLTEDASRLLRLVAIKREAAGSATNADAAAS